MEKSVQEYLFIGTEPVFYGFLPDLGKSLEVNPGDVVAFKNPPTDGLWVPVEAPPVVDKPVSTRKSS